MVLDGNAPDDDRSFISPAGYRLSKAMAVIGANASGKTSLIQGLVFLKWFMAYSLLALEPQEKIPIFPYFSARSEPSLFTLTFEHDKRIWLYKLEVTTERVHHESLYVKNTRAYSNVFKRDWNHEREEYIIKQNGFGLRIDHKSKPALDRQNVSLMSIAIPFGVNLARDLVSNNFFTNLYTFGGRGANTHRLIEVSKFYAQNNGYLNKASNILRGWDFGLFGVTLEKTPSIDENGQQKEIILPYGTHLLTDHETGQIISHQIPFFAESSGTQGAFILLSDIIPAIETGGAVVLDELESDLHPHMIPEIMNLFFYPETNPHNAQIIFTCHAMEVLKYLHKGQITLVEKNSQCESDAWRLDEMKGVRADDNFYAKYMAGAYGAVPNL